jgi:chemotaxis protein histidine kinase CheA
VGFYPGTMKIVSAPGKGRIIEIRIPLTKKSGYE